MRPFPSSGFKEPSEVLSRKEDRGRYKAGRMRRFYANSVSFGINIRPVTLEALLRMSPPVGDNIYEILYS